MPTGWSLPALTFLAGLLALGFPCLYSPNCMRESPRAFFVSLPSPSQAPLLEDQTPHLALYILGLAQHPTECGDLDKNA